MNIIVPFLAFALVTDQIGVIKSNEVEELQLILDNTHDDLPSKLRTIRIAGDTWPKLEFMAEDGNGKRNIEKRSRTFQKLRAAEADNQIADFWRNFGKTSEAVNKEAEVAPEVISSDDQNPPDSLPSPEDVNSENADQQSPIATEEEIADTTDSREEVTSVNNEKGHPSEIGSRSSQEPENSQTSLIDRQGEPPYYYPPRNEYMNPVQYVYPSPQQPYYPGYNLNMPSVYPNPSLTRPDLQFGYPQNYPGNQFYVPNNPYPYAYPQYYQPGIQFGGPPTLNYQPNFNVMGTPYPMYPSYSNMEPQQINVLSAPGLHPSNVPPQTSMSRPAYELQPGLPSYGNQMPYQ